MQKCSKCKKNNQILLNCIENECKFKRCRNCIEKILFQEGVLAIRAMDFGYFYKCASCHPRVGAIKIDGKFKSSTREKLYTS